MEDERKFADDHDDSSVNPLLDVGATSALDTSEGDDASFSLTGIGASSGYDWLSASPTLSDPATAAAVAPVTSSSSAPSITGTTKTTQFVTSGAQVHPFANVTINDPNPGAIDTVQIAINEVSIGYYLGTGWLGVNGSGQGVLSGPGLMKPDYNTLELTGSAATVTQELRGLIWSPGPVYATPTQYDFLIQLQSNNGAGENDDKTNYVNISTDANLAIRNEKSDYIAFPKSIIKYQFQNFQFGPGICNITPFYTDRKKMHT